MYPVFFSWVSVVCLFFDPVACGILVTPPEIQLVPPAIEMQNLNHWTTSDVPFSVDKHIWVCGYRSEINADRHSNKCRRMSVCGIRIFFFEALWKFLFFYNIFTLLYFLTLQYCIG